MFSSPMSHYFRHVLLSYREEGKSFHGKLEAAQKLSQIETELLRLHEKNPEHPKVKLLLEKTRKIKSELMHQ